MGNPVRPPIHQPAYAARFFAAFAALVLTMLLVASAARAGDVGSSPSTASGGADAGFLYANQAAGSLLATPRYFNRDEWLKNLSITGYAQSTVGLYVNSGGARSFHHHINSIESLRQLLQIDTNQSIGDNFQWFVRSWFVYEPEYPFEIDTKQKTKGGPFCTVNCWSAKSTSDFYNTYGPREYWIKLKTGPLTTFIGNQIATWGESLAFRIADVINPQDVSYAFGFNNLEASRQPIQMLHMILNLPKEGPFSSNFLETIYAPGLDVLWNHVDYPDDRYEGENSLAGRVNILPDTDNGGRAAGRTHTFKCIPGFSVCGGDFANTPLGYPTSKVILSGRIPGLAGGTFDLPRATFANSQVGVRLHTLIEGNTEATVFYWRSFDYSPTAKTELPGPVGTVQNTHELFPNYQGIGATANRPLYELPTWLINKLPIVLRGEMFYKNHASFTSLDPTEGTSISNSDQLLTMFALDVDSAPAPWLTTTGTLNSNLEWVNTLTFNSRKDMMFSQNVFNPVHHNDTNLFFDIGTQWWWNAVAPTWGMIYNPDGNTFLLVPSITLTPPWTNKYFMKIGTTYILGSDINAFSAGGSIKGLSSVFTEFQYNFKLL